VKDYFDLTDTGRLRRLRAIAIDVLATYDLDVVRLTALADNTNGIFRVDTAARGTFALRVGIGPPIGHTKREMESEAMWLEWVARDPELWVPGVVPNAAGHTVTVGSAAGVPGDRACALFTWLPGGLLDKQITPKTMGALGRSMARLHVQGQTFVPTNRFAAPSYDTVYPYDIPFILFTDAGSDLLPGGRRGLYEQAAEAVVASIASLSDIEPARVTHGDVHPWNVKVYRGRVSVFDFEDIVWAWPVQDLATTLYYFWSRPDFDARWADLRAGYESVEAWPDRGGEIATFIMGRSLVMANDVISQPEFRDEAQRVFEVGERRLADMLRRIGTGS